MTAPPKLRSLRPAARRPAARRPAARRWAALGRATGLLAAAALLVPLAACQSESPAERVLSLRADYQAELNGFQVRERPTAVAEPVPSAEPGAEPAPEAGAEAAPVEPEASEPPAGPPPPPDAMEPLPDETAIERDVVLDILLRNRGDETLPGITLDIEQVDAKEQVKANFKVYVEADGARPGGQPAAVSYTLEDVDFAEGDMFAVEVRPNVPEQAWGDYRELAEAAEGSAP